MQRYKAIAILQWELVTDGSSDPFQAARKELEQMLPRNVQYRISKLDRLKEKKTKIVIGVFSIDEVLPFVTSEEDRREYVVDGKSYLVRMNSHRYFIFRASCKCAACGLEGVTMLLEQHPNDRSPHFNLYAREDEELVLMTKDHIRAKARGGKNRHSNYQSMCSICNNLKGSHNLSLSQIRQLRTIYDNNKNCLSKKKLSALLDKVRIGFGIAEDKSPRSKHKKNYVNVKSDIGIFENSDGDLVGVSIYEAVDKCKGMRQVASIKKGTVVKVVAHDDHKLFVGMEDRLVSIYLGLTDFDKAL